MPSFNRVFPFNRFLALAGFCLLLPGFPFLALAGPLWEFHFRGGEFHSSILEFHFQGWEFHSFHFLSWCRREFHFILGSILFLPSPSENKKKASQPHLAYTPKNMFIDATTNSDIILTASAIYNIIGFWARREGEKPSIGFRRGSGRDPASLASAIREKPFWAQAFEQKWAFYRWVDADEIHVNTGRNMIDVVLESAVDSGVEEIGNCRTVTFPGLEDGRFVLYEDDDGRYVVLFRLPDDALDHYDGYTGSEFFDSDDLFGEDDRDEDELERELFADFDQARLSLDCSNMRIQ